MVPLFRENFGSRVATVTLPYLILGKVGNLGRFAMRTLNNTIRPAEFHHDGFTIPEVCEVNNCVLECLEAVHESIMAGIRGYVKYIIT